MTTFIIDDTEIPCELSITMLELKQKIIKECNIDSSYVDISFILDTPVRILGKFNVEPGKLPRTLDRYTLNRFALQDRMTLEYIEVDDYDPTKLNRVTLMSGSGRASAAVGKGIGAYVSPGIRKTSLFDHTSDEVSMDTPSFALDSESDFPSLGS
jgi:hypothetical protein